MLIFYTWFLLPVPFVLWHLTEPSFLKVTRDLLNTKSSGLFLISATICDTYCWAFLLYSLFSLGFCIILILHTIFPFWMYPLDFPQRLLQISTYLTYKLYPFILISSGFSSIGECIPHTTYSRMLNIFWKDLFIYSKIYRYVIWRMYNIWVTQKCVTGTEFWLFSSLFQKIFPLRFLIHAHSFI